MTWEELVKAKKEEVSLEQEDFGIPDRTILSEDVKLWRFKGIALLVGKEDSGISYNDLVPVYSGEVVVGAATLTPRNGVTGFSSEAATLVASVTATCDLPERLDFENGQQFRLLPEFIHRPQGGRAMHIAALHLRRTRGIEDIFFEIEPIGWEIA